MTIVLKRPKKYIKKKVKISYSINISMPFIPYYFEGHQQRY